MDTLSQLSALSSRFFTLPRGSKIPKEKWLETAKPFSELKLSGENIAVVCGLELVVLDIEGPRKVGSADGTRVLPSLEEALGRLPMAPTYRTPSGGLGILYRNPGRVIPKCDLGRSHGMEMRTGNHYCLLPPSTYQGEKYSGAYEWEVSIQDVMESEGELPTLPESWIDWFLEMTCKEPISVGNAQSTETSDHYDDTVKAWLWDISADIPYPDWWQVLAAVYRMTNKKEALELFLAWSKENGGHRWRAGKTELQVQRIWRDMPERERERAQTGEPLVGLSRLLDLAERYPMKEVEKPKTPEPPPSIMTIITSEPPKDLLAIAISKSSGLVRELYDHVCSLSREVPAFRMAAALSVVAGVVQRARKWPTGEAPNLLCFLVGPSSSTKSFFLEFVKTYVSEVDSNLLLPNVASEIVFQKAMSDCPSRTYAEDELGKLIEEAYINKQVGARNIVSLFLKYYQQTNMLPAERREASVPPVALATLSMIGVSTLQTMRELFAVRAYHSDGLASRFAYFVHPESLPLSAVSKPRWEPRQAIVDALRRILTNARDGLTVQAGGMSYAPSALKPFGDVSPITDAKERWVKELLKEEASMDNDELEEISSMRSRHLALVDKYALIHAMGRGMSAVEEVDAEFALALAKWNWSVVRGDVLNAQTLEERAADKILSVFAEKRFDMTVSEVIKCTSRKSVIRKLKIDALTKIFDNLAAAGVLTRVRTPRATKYRPTQA